MQILQLFFALLLWNNNFARRILIAISLSADSWGCVISKPISLNLDNVLSHVDTWCSRLNLNHYILHTITKFETTSRFWIAEHLFLCNLLRNMCLFINFRNICWRPEKKINHFWYALWSLDASVVPFKCFPF